MLKNGRTDMKNSTGDTKTINSWLICDELDVEDSKPLTKEFIEKKMKKLNIDGKIFHGTLGSFHVRDLLKYGIYITNNARKMHGETKTRRIAGRKRVRKPHPRKEFKIKGVKK